MFARALAIAGLLMIVTSSFAGELTILRQQITPPQVNRFAFGELYLGIRTEARERAAQERRQASIAINGSACSDPVDCGSSTLSR